MRNPVSDLVLETTALGSWGASRTKNKVLVLTKTFWELEFTRLKFLQQSVTASDRDSEMCNMRLSFSVVQHCSFWVFSKRQRITLRLLYAISRPSVVCLSACCLSVCLWRWCTLLRRLNFSAIFSPYDSSETLLFWCQKSLVGDAPFPLKFAFKVTHPL